MAKKTQPELTFEQAGAELDSLLAQLGDDDTTLEQAIALYARAAQLIAFCDSTLVQAQMKVEEIDVSLHVQDAAGEASDE